MNNLKQIKFSQKKSKIPGPVTRIGSHNATGNIDISSMEMQGKRAHSKNEKYDMTLNENMNH